MYRRMMFSITTLHVRALCGSAGSLTRRRPNTRKCQLSGLTSHCVFERFTWAINAIWALRCQGLADLRVRSTSSGPNRKKPRIWWLDIIPFYSSSSPSASSSPSSSSELGSSSGITTLFRYETNGVRTPIKSAILLKPPGPSTSSSFSFFPIV